MAARLGERGRSRIARPRDAECTLAPRWSCGEEAIVSYCDGDDPGEVAGGGHWLVWLGLGLGACALLVWQIAVFSLTAR